MPPLAELERWLARREAAIPDLRPEAGKRIRWAGAAGQRTPLALVYLHGFSACRQEVAPLCDLVARDVGANLFYARLTGHGRSPEAMAECSVSAWIDDGREALAIGRALGEHVVLIGTSQGGALATWLARHDPGGLHALVLLAPNYGPRARASHLLRWPLARHWLPWLIGRERRVEPENPGHAAHWTTRYPVTALFPMMDLAVAARRIDVEAISTPLLVSYCRGDTVVDARHTAALVERFGSRLKRELVDPPTADPGAHVIAGDVFAPEATPFLRRQIVDFLNELA